MYPSFFVFASSFLQTTFTEAIKAILRVYGLAKRLYGEGLVALKAEFLNRRFYVCPLFRPSLFQCLALFLHASLAVAVPAVLEVYIVEILGDR
jgi:hypothetical protein